MSLLRRGWQIEAPPQKYTSGPTQTGHTSELPNLTPEQANYLCHIAGVWKQEPQGFPVACYNPTTDQVILPAAKYWPSSGELAQMRAHEWAHARGWRHEDDGTGTSPNSLPPKPAATGGLEPPQQDPDQAASASDGASDTAVRVAKAMGGGTLHQPAALPQMHALIAAALRAIQLHHASRAEALSRV